jgi:ribonuclease HI
MNNVTIYTDGASKGNPGKGGYGTILLAGKHIKQLSQGYLLTTNNRMELLAVIIGLESLNRECNVTIYSDSKYVVDSIEKGWVFGWQKKKICG